MSQIKKSSYAVIPCFILDDDTLYALKKAGE